MQRKAMHMGKRRVAMILGMGLLFLAGMLIAAYQNSAVSREIAKAELGIPEVSDAGIADGFSDDCLDIEMPGRTSSPAAEDATVDGMPPIDHPGGEVSTPRVSRDGEVSTALDPAPSTSTSREEQEVPPSGQADGGYESPGDDEGESDSPHSWSTTTECPGR